MSERNNDEPGRRNSPVGKRIVPAVQWDDSNSRTISPNICTISATREEFSLIFGTAPRRQPGDQEIKIPNPERIVISPFLAKQVSIHLNNIIEKYETRFGPLGDAAPVKPGVVRGYTRELWPNRLESLPEKGRSLLQPLMGLGTRISFEPSLKIFEGHLLTNRFLVGINRQEFAENSDGRIFPILEQIAMPPALITIFSQSLPGSNYIYFGFEENEKTSLYKVYLEFRDRIEAEIAAGNDPSIPSPLFLGFKWDLSDQKKQAITQYLWYPSLPVPEILKRLREMVKGYRGRNILSVAEAVVSLAAERLSCEHIQYVEAVEEGNPRRSFDINVYKGALYLDEFHDWLMQLTGYYAIPELEFQLLYDRIRSKRLGHLAGGIDREGKDFLTIYYGVEEL